MDPAEVKQAEASTETPSSSGCAYLEDHLDRLRRVLGCLSTCEALVPLWESRYNG